MLDNTESALYVAALRGEAWAVCFLLKTQGKSRGYVERAELTGKRGGPLRIKTKHEHNITAELAPYADAFRALGAHANPLEDVPRNGAAKPLGDS